MKFIIENVEEDVEEWCSLEYRHICVCVGHENALFTRIPEAQMLSLSKKVTGKMFDKSVHDLEEIDWSRVALLDMDAENLLKPEDVKVFDSVLFGGILGNVPSDDLTSEVRKLSPAFSRHLGSLQMTTNTAVLVSKIILEDQVPFEKIPMVDEPEIFLRKSSRESVTLPFRYVAKSFFTKNEADRNEPVLPEGMLEYMRRSSEDAIDFD